MTPQQNPRKLVKYEPRKLSKTGRPIVPALIADAGERAGQRFVEFFTAEIRNRNTRLAYGRAVLPFLEWCEERGRELHEVDPVMVAAYIEDRVAGKTLRVYTLSSPAGQIRSQRRLPSRSDPALCYPVKLW